MEAPLSLRSAAAVSANMSEKDLLHHVDNMVFRRARDPRFLPSGTLDRHAFEARLNSFLKLFLRAPHWTPSAIRHWKAIILYRTESAVMTELVCPFNERTALTQTVP